MLLTSAIAHGYSGTKKVKIFMNPTRLLASVGRSTKTARHEPLPQRSQQDKRKNDGYNEISSC